MLLSFSPFGLPAIRSALCPSCALRSVGIKSLKRGNEHSSRTYRFQDPCFFHSYLEGELSTFSTKPVDKKMFMKGNAFPLFLALLCVEAQGGEKRLHSRLCLPTLSTVRFTRCRRSYEAPQRQTNPLTVFSILFVCIGQLASLDHISSFGRRLFLNEGQTAVTRPHSLNDLEIYISSSSTPQLYVK